MISLKYIRENLDFVKNSLIKKKSDIDIDELMILDENRREYLQTVEELRASKNKTSNQISNMMKVRKDAKSEIALMQNITSEIIEYIKHD